MHLSAIKFYNSCGCLKIYLLLVHNIYQNHFKLLLLSSRGLWSTPKSDSEGVGVVEKKIFEVEVRMGVPEKNFLGVEVMEKDFFGVGVEVIEKKYVGVGFPNRKT
jgi:hypothetical protein